MEDYNALKSIALKEKCVSIILKSKNSLEALEDINLPVIKQKYVNEMNALLENSDSNLSSIENDKKDSFSSSDISIRGEKLIQLINKTKSEYTKLKEKKKEVEKRKHSFSKIQNVTEKENFNPNIALMGKISKLNIYRDLSNLIVLRNKDGSNFECCVTDEATKKARITDLNQEKLFNYICLK